MVLSSPFMFGVIFLQVLEGHRLKPLVLKPKEVTASFLKENLVQFY